MVGWNSHQEIAAGPCRCVGAHRPTCPNDVEPPCAGGPCVSVLMPGEECEHCGRVAAPDEEEAD